MIATTRSRASASPSGWKGNDGTAPLADIRKHVGMEGERPDALGPAGMPQLPEQPLLVGVELALWRRLVSGRLQALEHRLGPVQLRGMALRGPVQLPGLSRELHGLAAGEAGEVDGEVGGGAVAAGVGIEDAA